MAEMPELNKQIIQEVEYFRDKYYTYDLPVPFKEHLMMYPVYIKDYNEFLACSSCLTLNKNDSIDGIRMTNVEFLISKMKDKEEGPLWSLKFTKILELCLHVKSGFKCPKCGKFLSFEEFYTKFNSEDSDDKRDILLCDCGEKLEETIKFVKNDKGKPEFVFEGVKVDNKDFNKLRQYLMYQNLPDYKDDSWVDKSIRDDQAAKAELKGKNSGTATLERKILGIVANTNLSFEEANSLTIRKFLMLLGMIDDIMNYTTTIQAIKSGFASLPKGETPEHWLYKKDEGLYGKAVDADAYRMQVQNK